MTRTEIFDGRAFRLTSWGNGLSYALECKIAGMEVFLQGDDAAQFRADLEAVSTHKPHFTFQQVAQWLWDQCGYGDAATPVAMPSEV